MLRTLSVVLSPMEVQLKELVLDPASCDVQSNAGHIVRYGVPPIHCQADRVSIVQDAHPLIRQQLVEALRVVLHAAIDGNVVD